MLLPSLSTAPEDSIRDLLASQRNREGPSLTKEEEDLLVEEIYHTSSQLRNQEWDGRAPRMNGEWSSTSLSDQGGRYMNGYYTQESLLAGSSSSPALATHRNPANENDTWTTSPLPTSTSFSSFQTFGVTDNGIRAKSPKSYGGLSFSGGHSALRDDETMRKRAKNQSNAAASSSTLPVAGSNTTTPKNEDVDLPPISPERANEYYKARQEVKRSNSPSGSERTATPTSSALPQLSGGLGKASDPLPDSAESSTFGRPPRKRQSLLSGLTPAQVKRISSALGEIEERLQRSGGILGQTRSKDINGLDEEEEMLDPTPITHGATHRRRQPSDARSESSATSTASSVFPFGVSPTNSSLTGNASVTGSSTTSPPRISHSPRSHNLHAHLEQPETRAPPPPQPSFHPKALSQLDAHSNKTRQTSPNQAAAVPTAGSEAQSPYVFPEPKSEVPRPILTPQRTQPIRHLPTLSLSSAGHTSPEYVYVPGQPRPVGSFHRSDGSLSSRSGTPSFSPSTANSMAGTPSPSNSTFAGHRKSDSTPAAAGPFIAPRSASLARSRSVNQSDGSPSSSSNTAEATPPKPVSLYGSSTSSISSILTGSQVVTTPPVSIGRYRNGVIPLGDPIGSRNLSSSLSSHSPATGDIIEEDEGEEEDARQAGGPKPVGHSANPPMLDLQSPTRRRVGLLPEIKKVPARKSVSESLSEHNTSPAASPRQPSNDQNILSFHTGQAPSGWRLSAETASCTVSPEGTIEESSETHNTSAITHESSTQDSHAPLSPLGLGSPSFDAYRRGSVDSLSSGFMEFDELGWDDLLTQTTPPQSLRSAASDGPPLTPGDELSAYADTLRKFGGKEIDVDEFMRIQDMLVEKAKDERQALRDELDESPMIPVRVSLIARSRLKPDQYSPPPNASSMPSKSAVVHRATSPSKRPTSPIVTATSITRPDVSESPEKVEQLERTPEPPPTSDSGSFPHPGHMRSASSQGTANSKVIITPLRAAPPPPTANTESTKGFTPDTAVSMSKGPSWHSLLTQQSASEESEVIFTPPSGLARVDTRRIALGDDPEVRKDFEARIAAATAALNRSPSNSAARLERKGTKRGGNGAMVISSPTLLSSSAKLDSTPLSTPESQAAATLSKSSDKFSGSGSKRSLRWKPFKGMRKGLSFSGDGNSPLASPSSQSSDPKLADPIALKAKDDLNNAAATPGPSDGVSPDLKAFKFPGNSANSYPQRNPDGPLPVAPNDAKNSKDPRSFVGLLRRGKSDDKVDTPSSNATGLQTSDISAPTHLASGPQAALLTTMHSHTLSTDSAAANFLAAGRAVGLTEDQLNEMLVSKGLTRSPSRTSISQYSTAATTHSMPMTSPNLNLGTPISTSGSPQTKDVSKFGEAVSLPSRSVPAFKSQAKEADSPESNQEGKRFGKTMGLLRSLSRSRRGSPAGTDMARQGSTEASASASGSDDHLKTSTARNVVVRRTLLIPSDVANGVSTPTGKSPATLAPGASPDSKSSPQRKASVKRKPLNLTREDQALVSGTPSHSRQVSGATSVPEETATPTKPEEPKEVIASLGLLHPNSTPTPGQRGSGVRATPTPTRSDGANGARSSGGGSFYDYYNNDDPGEETLVSPQEGETGVRSKSRATRDTMRSSTQAVEIT